MTELRLATWNVLHRVHAVNWGEDAVEAFPDESVRVARVTDAVRGLLQSGVSFVCLQEVSGDQLASLRAGVGQPRISVLDHLYPRVPKRRWPGRRLLTDASEHLVVLSAFADARLVKSATFDSDPGKGFLEVAAGGVRVICTHVSYGAKRERQLATLVASARSGGRPVAVLGDFNAEVDAVRAGLGEGFAVSDLTGQPCTRIATDSSRAHTIDHVAVLNGSIRSARVLDAARLSDHNPVEAVVAFG